VNIRHFDFTGIHERDKRKLRNIKFLLVIQSLLFIIFISIDIGRSDAVKNISKIEISKIIFTIIYDNTSYQENIKSGWGFSCLIQGPEKTILFDTGGEDLLLMRNLQKLTIDPKIVDIIFLSHIHKDHTGGLKNFLDINSDVTVYLLQSFPRKFTDQIKKYGAKVVEVRGLMDVCKDVYTTGELGGSIKEQSLVIKTTRGSIIITGCAHPGIVHIVKEVTTITQENVFLLFGGFHLRDYSQNEIEQISDQLKKMGVQYIGPTHCTGELARCVFKEQFSENYIELGAGKRIILEELE
jgi:7,8-dihydropterin-6-yl-methyl-4-(beta-D-ribofuranosyl)aminobenzene 5'-phosphate synthase